MLEIFSRKVLENPHRTVAEGQHKISMSLLERSFYRGNLREIAEWDRLGVLETAMKGEVPRSRRVYSRTLLTYFLDRIPEAPRRHEDTKHREDIAMRLWELGASQHHEMYDRWLSRTSHYKFADFLMDHGASPNARFEGMEIGTNPIRRMMESFATRNDKAYRGFEAIPPGMEDVFRTRIDRMLNYPASQSQKNLYLGRVVALAMRDSPVGQTPWVRWFDQLIAAGAKPSFETEHAFRGLVDSAPHRSPGMWEYADLVEKFKQDTGADPGEEEKTKLIAEFQSKRQSDWSLLATKWMDVLLQHVDRSSLHFNQSDNLHDHFWQRLLLAPSGVELGRKLLQEGIPAPWSEDTRCHSSTLGFLVGYSERHPDKLEQFVEMTEGTSVHPAWSIIRIREYLKKTSVDGNRSSGPGGTLHTPREIQMLLDISGRKKSNHLDHCFENWLSNLPQQWERSGTPLAARQAMMALLHKEDVWHDILSVHSAGSIDYQSTVKWNSFAAAWTKEPGCAEMLFDYPELAGKWKLLCALGNIHNDAEGVRAHWIATAINHDREFGHVIWEGAMVKGGAVSNGSRPAEVRRMFQTLAALRASGWDFQEASASQDLLRSAVSTVDKSWQPEVQRALVGHMKAAGMDFNEGNGAILSWLLEHEANARNSSDMEALKPLVEALVENGADPSLIPEIQPDGRPLASYLRIEQSRLWLCKATRADLPARSRRF